MGLGYWLLAGGRASAQQASLHLPWEEVATNPLVLKVPIVKRAGSLDMYHLYVSNGRLIVADAFDRPLFDQQFGSNGEAQLVAEQWVRKEIELTPAPTSANNLPVDGRQA